ncbi:hypothetical protein [Ekhidna sp.]|uniref:hypothetical protein n=1 Tax=Ekhidna sp. TaxID=2608089 RepID=UPI003B504FD1
MSINIVHIGFPKTATTFLQWKVFPNLKGINFIPYDQCSTIFHPIIYSDPLDYNLDEIRSRIDKENSRCLYSFESLAGSPFYFKGIGRSNIPQALKDLGFEKVVITVRKQVKAIDSYYRQYVMQGGTLSFKNWLDFDDERPIPQKYFQRGYLEYDKLIDMYAEVFGKQNVLLLTQESLKNDMSHFIHQITEFTETEFDSPKETTKANVSLSNLSIAILRLINHFTFSSIRPFHLISKRISNRPIWKIFVVVLDPYLFSLFSNKKSFVKKHDFGERIEAFYSASNGRLNEEWEIDLNKQ